MELCVFETERLKREDCNRTKHDSQFSKWQILVGPNDWEDHCSGKEGATRYRTHNLPTSSGPGLYEFGVVALPNSGLGREVGKLDSSDIVVTYLGEAGNVRKRLQGYGRSGNHLGKSYSSGCTNASKDVPLRKGSGFFEEMFARGYSIVYRWAPICNKSEAKKTEAELLDRFDYAWNKGRNCASRPNDILQKLNKRHSSNITRKIKYPSQKPVGVKIKASKPLLLENENSSHNNESKKLLPQVFKNTKSQPRLISVTSSPFSDDLRDSKVKLQLDAHEYPNNGDLLPICGVTLDNGASCMRPPVPGKVRCEDHKWRNKCESISISTTKVKSSDVNDAYISSTWILQDEISICGVELGNGKLCRNQPVARRQRCEKHKGLRVDSLVHKDIATKGNHCTPEFERLSGSSYLNDKYIHSSSWSFQDETSICGVELGNGRLCRNQAVARRQRCEEHKGLRVDSLLHKDIATKGNPCAPEFERRLGFSTFTDKKYNNVSSQHIECRTPVYNDFSNICGATTLAGHPCSRQPANGSRRCWQHYESESRLGFSTFTDKKYSNASSRHIECRSPVYNDFSNICGATTRAGHPCSRRPANGSRRCWQH